jgi:hypothetical protein
MMLDPARHDRHRICDDEKEMGVEVAWKGRYQIQGARGGGTLGERTREVTEKFLKNQGERS